MFDNWMHSTVFDDWMHDRYSGVMSSVHVHVIDFIWSVCIGN